jgi:hypothetical protein
VTGVEPTSDTPSISNIPCTVDIVQHNIVTNLHTVVCIMNINWINILTFSVGRGVRETLTYQHKNVPETSRTIEIIVGINVRASIIVILYLFVDPCRIFQMKYTEPNQTG